MEEIDEEEYQKWFKFVVHELFTVNGHMTCAEFKHMVNKKGLPSWWPPEFARRNGIKLTS